MSPTELKPFEGLEEGESAYVLDVISPLKDPEHIPSGYKAVIFSRMDNGQLGRAEELLDEIRYALGPENRGRVSLKDVRTSLHHYETLTRDNHVVLVPAGEADDMRTETAYKSFPEGTMVSKYSHE